MAKKNKKITQSGLRLQHESDIVLQMPELFHFDLNAYMSAVNAASSIDYSHRVRLYDMYESAQFDLHLAGVLDKRLRAVRRLPIEFQRDGEPDERINEQIASPWFKDFRRDLLLSHFWGFSLFQFYTDPEGNIQYTLVPRKHYNPITRQVLKYQGDQSGTSIDNVPNTLFIGHERALGIFAELLPAVLYKRGNMGDWARFCNIFGLPIREYTYDAGDEEARRRLIADARRQGTNAVYIHPRESSLNLIDSGNKSASSELFRTFTEYWDSQISIRVLGNTLTTDVQSTGTQALGTVHQDEEVGMNEEDREFVLDVLNYEMTEIFAALGYNTEGGKFVYAKKEDIDPAQQIDILLKLSQLGLPLDHDYLYETFGVRKPEDYDAIIEEKAAQKAAIQASLEPAQNKEEEPGKDPEADKEANPPQDELKEPKQKETAEEEPAKEKPAEPQTEKEKEEEQQKKKKKTTKNLLKRFFAWAPRDHGADSNDW